MFRNKYFSLCENVFLESDSICGFFFRYAKSKMYITSEEAIFASFATGQMTVLEVSEQLCAIFGGSIDDCCHALSVVLFRYCRFFRIHDLREVGGNFAINYPDLVSAKEFRYRNSAPLELTWIVTRCCELRCSYCYMQSTLSSECFDSSLSLFRIKSLLLEGYHLGIQRFGLTGGEPFLRKDVFEIIQYAVDLGYAVTITTKFELNAAMVQKLRLASSVSVEYSLDSIDPIVGDGIVGRPGHTIKAMKTIQRLCAAGVGTTIFVVVVRESIASLFDTLSWIKQCGVAHVRVVTRLKHSSGVFDDLLTAEEVAVVSKIVLQFSPFAHLETASCGARGCGQGLYSMTILPDGMVTRCVTDMAFDERIICGDILTRSISEVWTSQEYMRCIFPEKNMFGYSCRDCDLFFDCSRNGWCIYSSYLQNGVIYGPDSKCKRR